MNIFGSSGVRRRTSSHRRGGRGAPRWQNGLPIVAPWAKWSFQHHPRVRCFDTLEAAVAAIVAADKGERMRREVLARPLEYKRPLNAV